MDENQLTSPKTNKDASSNGEITTFETSGQHEKTHAQTLSRDETREILTPFAFEIDKSLFGLPLALPYKRAGAILIDLLAIAILSGAPGELLAIVLAVTFYKLGNNKKAQAQGKVKGYKRRRIARFFSAFIIFVMLVDFLPQYLNDLDGDSINNGQQAYMDAAKSGTLAGDDLDLKSSIVLTAMTTKTIEVIKQSQCNTVDCWQSELLPLISSDALIGLNLKPEFIEEAVDSVVEEIGLSKDDQQQLKTTLMAKYQLADTNFDKAMSKLDTLDTLDEQVNRLAVTPEKETKPVYSIVEFIKSLIEDLGLGFGWAAFYFTVLTSIWKGQTLGKKVFNIKVLQLDGTPLSLWDSFGRYGGYGAGIATGLLGFIQIFWDANRQAIHDQISSTVVIDVINNEDNS